MSEQIEVVMKRYAARNYAGSESVKRGHDAYAIADHACEVLPKLVEACEAALLFHSGGDWSEEKRARWFAITQTPDATTKVLCNTIRDAISKAKPSNP